MGIGAVLVLEYLEYALFFGGMVTIVALALDHMLNHAGIPAFVNRIPVLLGAFTVSAVSTRLVFAVAASAGVKLLDWGSEQGWIYNSQENTRLVNEFLAGNPALCIGLILFTFAASIVLGGLGGWLLTRAALRLGPVLILMVTFALTDVGCVFGRNVIWLGGGTLGLSVPNPLAFAQGAQRLALAVIMVAVAAGVYLVLGRLEASPWGRLVAAAADNPVTAASLGKDIVSVGGRVVLYSSGLMALSGAIWSFYSQYVSESAFHNWTWLFWPLMAVLIGGPGGRWRIVLGAGVFFALQEAIRAASHASDGGVSILQSLFFFPISYFEDMLFSVIILLALARLSRIMARRRAVGVRGVRYEDAVESS